MRLKKRLKYLLFLPVLLVASACGVLGLAPEPNPDIQAITNMDATIVAVSQVASPNPQATSAPFLAVELARDTSATSLLPTPITTDTLTPTPTPVQASVSTPVLSLVEAERFMLDSLFMACLVDWEVREAEVTSRYIGNHTWLLELHGVSERLSSLDSPRDWTSGLWRLDELTGDLLPYDPRARILEESGLHECEKRWTTTPPPGLLLLHVDPNGQWQIYYPAGWEVDTYLETLEFEGQTPSLVDAETLSFTRPSGDFSVLSVTRLVSYGRALDLPYWSAVLLLLSTLAFDPYEVISWENVTVGEKPAYEAVLSNEAFTKIELHLIIGEDAYWIQGMTGQNRWVETEELLRALVYSFQPTTIAGNSIPTPEPAPTFTPTNWVQAYQQQYGSLPQYPDWMSNFFPSKPNGILSRDDELAFVPTPGYFENLVPSKQRMVIELFEWLGGESWEDLLHKGRQGAFGVGGGQYYGPYR